MSARTVIEHALRVYFADSRDPNGLVDTLLARYEAERPPFPPLYVADYEGAELTLHLTHEDARAVCDDFAKVEAHGRCWDWRTEEGDIDRQFWTHPDDDSPVGYTGGAVWQIRVEPSEKDTRSGSPQQGESTPNAAPDDPAAMHYAASNDGWTVHNGRRENCAAGCNGNTYPPMLPWARLMDDEDLTDFLDELSHAAIPAGESPQAALAEVEDMCERWRALAEVQHAHNVTGPGEQK